MLRSNIMPYNGFSKSKFLALAVVVIAVILVVVFFGWKNKNVPQQNTVQFQQSGQNDLQNQAQNMVQPDHPIQIQTKQTVDPLPNAISRITKKPFGIYITPKTSPVQPERFQGYHTAVDLETTPDEQNIDVPVKALCDGKLLVARTASGYGGVAVQSCTLDGQDVTVIYGHIRLSSVVAKIGDQLKAGDFLADLGTGFSSQTDGERKHLHLGIHKGTGINILGYVPSQGELAGWLDSAQYLD